MSSTYTINWLLNMSVDISVLLVFVLVIRKPVARLFRATPAYALWLLPALGIFMPEIKLPSQSMELPSTIVTTYSSIKQTILIEPVTNSQQSINWGAYILVAWILIGVLWFVFQLLSYRHSYRTALANSKPASTEIHKCVSAIVQEINLSTLPHFRTCLEGGVPMVLGLRKPMIILPENIEVDFTNDELDMILAHEMMHIKRADLWVGFVVLMYRAVNWPNPLLHFSVNIFRGDQEAACDASVLKSISTKMPNKMSADGTTKQTYLNALLKTVKINGGI